MMDDFCFWAPWVFSALAFALGWLLRSWYDDGKFSELNDKIKEKESDVYHLNEAHNLLLKDKNKKISEFDSQMALKERVISELRTELGQTTKSTKNLLSQVVESKQKSSPQPVSIVSVISEKAKKKKKLMASVSSQKTKKKSKTPKKKSSVASSPSTDKKTGRSKIDASTKKPKKKKSKTSRIKKFKQIIKDLRAENQRLNEKSDKAKSIANKTVPTKTIVKEIPTTLTRTILIKEKVDQKKLRKVLKNVPFKKTKKIVSEKLKKGKAKIVNS